MVVSILQGNQVNKAMQQASVVALMARDEGLRGIVAQILSFPVTCHPKVFPKKAYEMGSYQQNSNDSVVTAARMEWFWDLYVPEPTDNWRYSPLLAQSLKNLPPACKSFILQSSSLSC